MVCGILLVISVIYIVKFRRIVIVKDICLLLLIGSLNIMVFISFRNIIGNMMFIMLNSICFFKVMDIIICFIFFIFSSFIFDFIFNIFYLLLVLKFIMFILVSFILSFVVDVKVDRCIL